MTTFDEGALRVARCGAALAGRKHPVRVVAWIIDDAARPGEDARKRAARSSERTQRIKQRLAWLTARVLVEDPRTTALADVRTENLAAGHR